MLFSNRFHRAIKLKHLVSILFLPLTLMLEDADAGLYKWVDENGNVQYSDTPPRKKAVAEVESISTNPKTNFELPEQKQPALKPRNRPARQLLLVDTTYFWDRNQDYEYSRKVGSYFVGKSCSPRGAMKVPEVFSDHSTFLPPKTKDLTYAIRRTIHSLSYDSHRVEAYQLLAKLERSGGLALHSEIVELKIDTCAPKLTRTELGGAVRKISDREFTRNRVRLKILWKLMDNRGQDLIFKTTSEGAYNGWNTANSMKNAINKAIESSVFNLFADEAFLDHVLVPVDKVDTHPYIVEKPKPIRLTNAQRGNAIHLTMNPWLWQQEIVGEEQFGNFYFGQNCQAGNPISIDEMMHYYQHFLPSRRPAQIAVQKATAPLGYRFQHASESALEKVKNSGGLHMIGVMVEIDMNVCAPKLKPALMYTPIKSLSSSHFVRQKVKLKIRWSLYRGNENTPIYQAETVGYGGDLLKQWINKDAFTNAIRFSIRSVLSKPAMVRLLVEKVD